MAAQGTGFDTPRACPFVALELDRDRRSDTPDYRHRCFAEPTPAPRSIAHQEAYCLSPNFPACPVFQDWAVRAAARPVASGGSSAAAITGAAVVGGAAAAGGAAASDVGSAAGATETTWSANTTGTPSAAATDEPAIVDLPEDASVTPAGAEIAAAAAAATGIASPPTFATTWENEAPDNEQLGAFDPTGADAHSSYGEPDAGYPEPAIAPAFVPPPAPPRQEPQNPAQSDPSRDAATLAVPAFLAGRATRPANPSDVAAANPPPRPASGARDEIVPSWDIDGRYGAEPQSEAGGGGNRLDGILTAIAVVAILGLGVAAVLFLPGLLNKGKPAVTPGPSIIISSAAPSALPSGLASVSPSAAASVAPTSAPTAGASQGPASSPRPYRIKAGDSLARIANRFGVTVQDILDANPNIANPDNIFVGQLIVIPVGAGTSP
jgi:LysM repeat protein